MIKHILKPLTISITRLAFEFLEEVSKDPELFREYQRLQDVRVRRIMAIADRKAREAYWFEEAYAKAKSEGRAPAPTSLAKVLKKYSVGVDRIAELTKLPKEEILAL